MPKIEKTRANEREYDLDHVGAIARVYIGHCQARHCRERQNDTGKANNMKTSQH